MRISMLLVAASAVTALAGSALAQPPGGGAPGGGRGPGLTPEQAETVFKGADANKDGKLDKTEFNKAINDRTTAIMAALGGGAGAGRGPQTQEQTDMQFGRYDANMDGSVSLDEFKTPPAGRGGGGGGGRGGPGGPGGGGGGGRGGGQ